VVTVMSVQPTSANRTALHEAGSAAWAMKGRLNEAAKSRGVENFKIRSLLFDREITR
jgi:hypothetical protein